ncbi:hypothetical protein [Desulfatiglans anilini]|uniref:hypothetical protein n=1 Tax=Desulfatiglans anilini TaxID=90728 RepID=UPI000406A86C|nr:hypothetical protein [Desulfatiglans anilini]
MSYQVAQEVVAHCPSCKMDLMHVIVALDRQRIVRVICLTCRKEHAYHRPHEGATPESRVKKPRTPVRKRPDPESVKWQEQWAAHPDAVPKPYSIQSVFSSGDVLEHPVFGIGFVTRIVEPGKMEVLFREGPKRLAFDRG